MLLGIKRRIVGTKHDRATGCSVLGVDENNVELRSVDQNLPREPWSRKKLRLERRVRGLGRLFGTPKIRAGWSTVGMFIRSSTITRTASLAALVLLVASSNVAFAGGTLVIGSLPKLPSNL